ncbi:MAG: TIGR04283 family arsenosugar biosynthesis glycosyltransferase [Nitrospiraceae bacterium]
MTISVVIPTLNEERTLRTTLTRAAESGFDEVIVVDGGSMDRTRQIVTELRVTSDALPVNPHLPPVTGHPSFDGLSLRRAQPSRTPSPIEGSRVTLLTASPGRAFQMNAGAAASRGQILLFLHADTLLPPDARSAIEKTLQDPAYVGGRFDVRFERDSGLGRLIGCLINLRSRWTGIATGDQAIFLRRSVFERLGGFSDIPIMEDVDLSRRLKRIGPVAALRLQVVTSFRRWDACGPIRTIALMWALRFLYWVGISPGRLARVYASVR